MKLAFFCESWGMWIGGWLHLLSVATTKYYRLDNFFIYLLGWIIYKEKKCYSYSSGGRKVQG